MGYNGLMVLSKQIKYVGSVSDFIYIVNQGLQGSSGWSQTPLCISDLEKEHEE